MKEHWIDRVGPYVLDGVILGVWVAINYAIFFGGAGIDSSVRDLAMRAMGIIDAALLAVLYYHRGTSRSSARKTEAMLERIEHD